MEATNVYTITFTPSLTCRLFVLQHSKFIEPVAPNYKQFIKLAPEGSIECCSSAAICWSSCELYQCLNFV